MEALPFVMLGLLIAIAVFMAVFGGVDKGRHR